jgi:hypothetical protein
MANRTNKGSGRMSAQSARMSVIRCGHFHAGLQRTNASAKTRIGHSNKHNFFIPTVFQLAFQIIVTVLSMS